MRMIGESYPCHVSSQEQASREQPGEQGQRPQPFDPPMVPFALGGMALWALAGGVLLLARDRLADHGHTNWLWICLAGFLLGRPGLAVMLRHDANRRIRRAERRGTGDPD